MAEIKQPLTQTSFKFTSDEWEDMLEDYIGVNGVNSFEIYIDAGIIQRKNSTVFIKEYFSECCSEKCFRLKEGVLIDPDRNLVLDKETGRYLFVDSSKIEYSDLPIQPYTEVNIMMSEPVNPSKMEFFYLTKSVKWVPIHSLDIIDSHTALLRTSGKILNTGKNALSVAEANLLDTDLHVLYEKPTFGYADKINYIGSGIGQIQETSHAQFYGLIKYRVHHQFSIPSRGYILLPLINARLSAKEINTITVFLNEGENKGKLDKVLRIKAPFAIPKGSVVIQRDGWMIGSSVIPKLVVEEQRDLLFGINDDVAYVQKTFIEKTERETIHIVKVFIKFHNYNKQNSAPVEYQLVLREGFPSDITSDFTNVTATSNKIEAHLKVNASSVIHAYLNFTWTKPKKEKSFFSLK